MPRLIALDYGRARIGIAACDALGIAVTPLGFVARQSDAQAATVIAALARQERAEGVVIGLPLHASGAAGENVAWVRAFIAALARVCPLPVHEVDERYSTAEAEDLLRQRGEWPAKPGRLDAASAAVLLSRYLAGER
jgi:putative Holliday junction resolvase